MSYIRRTQEGSYVDIPRGSQHYLYDDGDSISGYSYEEWAALIGSTAYEIAIPYERAEKIAAAFKEYYGGWDDSYEYGIHPPERAEIFCQCVDNRLDGVELTPAVHDGAKLWAKEFDAMRQCHYCDTALRPAVYLDDTRYVCDSDTCMAKHDRYREEMREE